MEVIATSVSSFKLHQLHPQNNYQLHHLKTPNLHPHAHISTNTNTSISTKPTPSSHSHHKFTPPPLPSTPSPIHTHRNPATGYAAALVDTALRTNSLQAIHQDVKRLSKWLHHNPLLSDMMADPSVDEGVKGKVIKEAAKKANFRRQTVALVKMLAAKNKSGMVAQVMEEFQRIYYQLNYTLQGGFLNHFEGWFL